MSSNPHSYLIRPLGDLRIQEGGEALYQTILEALHDGVVFLDPELRVVTCNSSVERIFGLSRSQLTGLDSVDPQIFGAIDEAEKPMPEEAHPSRVALRTGAPCVGVVQGIRNARGELTWINVNAQPLRGALEPGGSFRISASFGVTAFDPSMDHETFLDIADRALYKAKSGGRNRVEMG